MRKIKTADRPTSVKIREELKNDISIIADQRRWTKHQTILVALEYGLKALKDGRP